MKTDRFSLILLAGLLLAAGRPAAGQSFRIGIPTFRVDSSKALAQALALQVAEVGKTFAANRRALRKVRLAGGEQVCLRKDLDVLFSHTAEDLDRAIQHVRPSGLEALSAWAAVKIRNVQEQLAPPPGQTAASISGFSTTPRAVAVVASLGGLPLPWLASVASGPREDTVPAETADRLLDQVENVINRIFVLASHDDLEVTLWVGSTAPHARFSFGPRGQVKGAAKAAKIIRTDGKLAHVVRGLYGYRAAWANGPVTEVVEYPNPASVPASHLESEELDLVNGSSFFCCRFSEEYCHHVADEKECRP